MAFIKRPSRQKSASSRPKAEGREGAFEPRRGHISADKPGSFRGKRRDNDGDAPVSGRSRGHFGGERHQLDRKEGFSDDKPRYSREKSRNPQRNDRNEPRSESWKRDYPAKARAYPRNHGGRPAQRDEQARGTERDRPSGEQRNDRPGFLREGERKYLRNGDKRPRRADIRPGFRDQERDNRGASPAGRPSENRNEGLKSPRRFDNRSEKQPEKRLNPIAPTPQEAASRDRDSVLIWGQHAVKEAWLNPKRRCYRLRATETALAIFQPAIASAAEQLLKRPDAGKVDRQELDRLTPPGSVHQGIVLEAAPLTEPSLADIIGGDQPPDLLLMLDQVTDPHNVGAILRSAAAFGAGAVIMTERNAPTTTGVLAKSASGALEHVPQIHVVNLARALDDLQQAGYWCVGLAEEAPDDLSKLDLTGRTVLVLGAEGEGLRQLTRKKCSELARLPSGGPIGSLNVSNAAAVSLYEVRRQKKNIG